MPSSELFKKLYKQLNPEQKKAVDTIEGPVMVIAGPGTGKTQVLTLRIANILLKTDTPPEAVLALTFTEKATYNMRQRLAHILGQVAYRIRIRTFHGFANEIIQSEPDQFPHIIGGSAITEPDQLALVEEILNEQEAPLLRPLGRPEAYVKSIKAAIDDLKREGLDPIDFEKTVSQEEKALAAIDDLLDAEGKVRAKYRSQERAIRKQKELVRIYREYQKALNVGNLYDYADMLSEVARALESDEQLRLILQEKFLYILVDEHQDTNFSQNRIVQLIGESEASRDKRNAYQPNIFVVGDLQQAIYRFQGASLANFKAFTGRYPKTAVIRLEKNYRSTQAILEAAAGISPAQNRLVAHAGHKESPVQTFAFSSPSVQEYAVARMIQERIRKGIPADQIAIIYRTNAEAAGMLTMLERLTIPCAVESDDEVLTDIQIKKLLLVAYALKDIGQSGPLLRALTVDFLNVPALDAAKVAAEASRNHINAWDIIRSPKRLQVLDLEDATRTQEIYRIFSELAKRMVNASASNGLEHVITETGFLAHVLSLSNGERVLAKLHALFELIRAQMESNKTLTLAGFLDTLELLDRHKTALRVQPETADKAVRLMTVHKAKGLEFETVFIINAAHGHWDGSRPPAELKLPPSVWRVVEKITDDLSTTTEADMRNLFYVAVTRAKHEAIITWPERKADGKEQSPSMFVLAIPGKYKKAGDVATWERLYLKDRNMRLTPQQTPPALASREYLRTLFRQSGLSVTALNNYLTCPWRYYFLNLIRIPEAPHISSEYGKAAHGALKIFFDAFSKGEITPTKTYLLESFERILKRAPLPQRPIKQALAEGQAALTGWYNFYHVSFQTRVQTEVAIDGIVIDDIPLTGKLDKLEFAVRGDEVNVVDYKTKSPMSANEILGKTKNATGNEFRQLVFYKLLLNQWQNGKYKMKTGEIDFLEPNESGKYKKEKFEITNRQVADLAIVVHDVIKQILELVFWDSRCDDPKCDYCELRSMMK